MRNRLMFVLDSLKMVRVYLSLISENPIWKWITYDCSRNIQWESNQDLFDESASLAVAYLGPLSHDPLWQTKFWKTWFGPHPFVWALVAIEIQILPHLWKPKYATALWNCFVIIQLYRLLGYICRICWYSYKWSQCIGSSGDGLKAGGTWSVVRRLTGALLPIGIWLAIGIWFLGLGCRWFDHLTVHAMIVFDPWNPANATHESSGLLIGVEQIWSFDSSQRIEIRSIYLYSYDLCH